MQSRPSVVFALASSLAIAGVAACGSASDDAASNGSDGGAGTSGAAGGGGAAGKASGGAAGNAGNGGKAGNAGTAGASGVSGAAGASGVSGAAGQAGASGVSGAAGQAGVSGAAGNPGGGAAGAAGASAGNAGAGGATCPASCPAGSACVGAQCVADCRLPKATPCDGGKVCNVSDDKPGTCQTPGTGCVVSSADVTCGAEVCGPGTECGPSNTCLPTLPCLQQTCTNGRCVGAACACARKAACQPAPLGKPGDVGTLNDPAFARTGANANEGIIDLDFDPQCNAWATTFISGPDFLRKIDPAGKVTSVTGVTNLNMGEVAVLLGKDGQFGGGLGDVALTYICCQTCGCIISGPSGNPQGAAVFDAATSMLPMKIPTATFTQGMGPFGSPGLDTGPYGLTWGLDRVLYLGNVSANGDFVALDLTGGNNQTITTFTSRVNASAPFDRDRVLVAVEGGEVFLVPTLGLSGAKKSLVKLPTHVTSLARDSFTGRVFASLADKTIVSFKPDGTDVKNFATATEKGRIALGPDGFLYHLATWPIAAVVTRYPLPLESSRSSGCCARAAL